MLVLKITAKVKMHAIRIRVDQGLIILAALRQIPLKIYVATKIRAIFRILYVAKVISAVPTATTHREVTTAVG
jgi:hypothetical protein